MKNMVDYQTGDLQSIFQLFTLSKVSIKLCKYLIKLIYRERLTKYEVWNRSNLCCRGLSTYKLSLLSNQVSWFVLPIFFV